MTDNTSLIEQLAKEGREMRERNIKAQNRDDLVMKLLFVAMCPLLLPILFIGERKCLNR